MAASMAAIRIEFVPNPQSDPIGRHRRACAVIKPPRASKEGELRMITTSEKRDLEKGAKQLIESLGHLSLPFSLHSNPHAQKYEADGWWIELGTWRGFPSFGVSLQRILDGKHASYWYGFWSPQASKIQALANSMPVSLQPRTELNDDDFDLSDNLLEPIPPEQLAWPVIESYKNEYYYYFGRYDYRSKNPPIFNLALGREFISGVAKEILDRKYLSQIDKDVAEVQANPSTKPTTKKQLIDARRGQGKYRKVLERKWGGCCAVSKCDVREVLRASHIKSWKLSDTKERLDADNGLLLSAQYDAMFDKNLISFSDSGKMIVSDCLSMSQRNLLRVPKDIDQPLSARQKAYLEFHRKALVV
jgi:hypothetical protein